ncbi:helix-turn-helix domain-containing protein [Halococcus sediminicola]|uniref:helix-turn-helix domain-containing protein n=1 Tax=Halococcus sediminicola TaxID=1264579 RepID=UPI000678860A|nr:helix-turn-helix domain-containing protein [Halococcus sediminicola]
MTLIASFSVDTGDIEFGQALAGTETRIELTQFVPVGGQFIPYFWKERGGDRETFEQSVREHPAVADLVYLDGRVDAALYRIDWTDDVDGFLNALCDLDIIVEEASTNHGEKWSFRLRAFDQAGFTAFQHACSDHGINLDMRRMIHNPDAGGGRHDRALVGVTEKQREAIELALEQGYFEVPRQTTATELAEKMDISRQAFSRRLQRAEQTVFTNLLTDFGEQ